MARTQITGDQVKDATIQRKDLDVTTTGQAVATKVVAGDNISLSSTGADSGTGDVTVSVTGLATVATSGDYTDLSNTPTIPSALDELSDVVITSATTDQILKYDGSNWINDAAPAAGASSLDELSDVAVSSAAKGQLIVHDGTQFINSNTIEASDAAIKPLIVKGAASQTANLLEVQNSAGTVLSSISSAGAAYFASNIITVGTITFGIAGSGMALKNGGYNGVSLGRSSSAGESGLALGSYVSCGTNAMVIGWGGGGTGRQIIGLSTGEVGIGTATPGAQLHLIPKATTMKGLIVQGLASQTANLLEVQDSAATALFTIDKDGSVAAGTVPVARVSGLATVATSGDYTDLSNTPSIPSALDDLSDVVITSATTDEILKYDGSNWINAAAPAAGASSLDELSDVTLTSSASGEFLKYDGSAWINSTLPEANASQSGVVTTAAQTIAGEKTFTASVLNVGPQISGSSAYISVKYNYTQMYFGFVPGYGATAGTQQAGTPFILRSAFVEGLRLEGSNNVDVPRVGINNSAPTAQLDIIARSASTKGLIVKGAASQTANLLEVQDSADNAIFTVDPTGTLNIRNTAGSYLSIGLIDGIFSTLRIGRANGTKGSGYNLWIGDQAGFRYADNSGSGNNQNTGVGHLALRGSGVTTAMNGNANVALGYAAGQNVSGTFPSACFNTLIGASTAQTLTTGSSNIVIGWEADCGATANYQIALGVGAETTGADAVAIGRNASAAANCMDIRFGNASRITGDSSGNVAIANTLSAKRYTETATNAFNTALSPSSGTLTVDSSLGNAVLGALDASVTTWAFTNVPTDNSKVTTVTAVLEGNTSYTYGDACSVNGTAVTDGIKWSGGSAPTSTAGTDIITFIIVKDSAGDVKVFGSATTNFS